MDQKGRSAETSAMSIAAVDLAVAATLLANFFMDSGVDQEQQSKTVQLATEWGGWLDFTHYPTTANSGRHKIRLYKLFMRIEQERFYLDAVHV